MSMGRVWLVGAGPGDPDLLTVKGRRLLKQADAVVHDRLVGEGVLDLIPEGALRVDVGKTGFGPGTPQADIVAMLIRLARAGLDVVRLKGGDPFVFGRGGEEAMALRAAGVPCGVVPGVTAGVAAPAIAGIPVTHRGLARSVAFVTATASLGGSSASEPDWAATAAMDTIVVFMAGRLARSVAVRLLAAGRAGTTPVALIMDASLPSQEVEVTTLEQLAARPAAPATAGRATLLVVGDVVSLREAIDGRLSLDGTLAPVPAAHTARAAR
jgi:uroporphyrin-III C-methyltransferase